MSQSIIQLRKRLTELLAEKIDCFMLGDVDRLIEVEASIEAVELVINNL